MGESAQRLTVHQDAELLVLTNDLHLNVTAGQDIILCSVSYDIITNAGKHDIQCKRFSFEA